MSASDYDVSFPYGATSRPYSPSSPHRGEDRPCPWNPAQNIYTPLVIGGQTIGITGATGKTYDAQGNMNTPGAAHLHIQEWNGSYANTRKPQNSFKPGVVTNIDPTGTQGDGSFGKFITIQTEDGWNDTYAHLSEINVSVGDKIGGNMEEALITKDILEILCGSMFGSAPDKADYDNWVGKYECANMVRQFENDQRRKNYYASVQKAFDALNNPPGFEPVSEQLYKKKG